MDPLPDAGFIRSRAIPFGEYPRWDARGRSSGPKIANRVTPQRMPSITKMHAE
jgi:hypothetical protein